MKTRLLCLAAGLACLLPALFTPGCAPSESVVQWPALKEMDEWAEKGEGWADDGKVAEMRKALPDILKAGEKLAASPVPGNAKDSAAVAQTMGDFRALLKQLQKPALADDELKASVASIHPLVEKLMGDAGLPHVHEHPEDKAEKK